MPPDTPALLRCPFCGGSADTVTNEIDGSHQARCVNDACDVNAITYSFDTHEEAEAAWNTRHLPPLTEEEVDAAALGLWQHREMAMPRRVARMKPDDFDRQSGAWDLCREAARAALSAFMARRNG